MREVCCPLKQSRAGGDIKDAAVPNIERHELAGFLEPRNPQLVYDKPALSSSDALQVFDFECRRAAFV